MKKILSLSMMLLMIFAFTMSAGAADITHTVVRGDTMWKLAVKYQVGFYDIIDANPQIENPDLIYPTQKLTIPKTDEAVLSFEAQVIKLVNDEREKYGLEPLKENWELSRVARMKSKDMSENGYFSHTSPTYGSPFDMMRSFGLTYNTAGENIAFGQRTPEAVVNAWMNSEGHRKNILNPSFSEIGVGYEENGRYWTQMFIG